MVECESKKNNYGKFKNKWYNTNYRNERHK